MLPGTKQLRKLVKPPRQDKERDGEDGSLSGGSESAESNISHSDMTDFKNSPHNENNVLIFKLSLFADLPNSYNYELGFLDFEKVEYHENEGDFSLVFAARPQNLSSQQQTLKLFATDKELNELKATCTLDVSEIVETLCKKLESADKWPVMCESETEEELTLEEESGQSVTTVRLKLALVCCGPTLVSSGNMNQFDFGDGDSMESVPETAPANEYDEYTAQINGHTLNIQMLKKNKHKKCKDTNNQNAKEAAGNKGSEIVFQMPTTQSLCSKNPPRTMAYNIRSCRDEKHSHEGDAVQVSQGTSSAEVDSNVNDAESDCFTIAIGKKGCSGKGRLELKLKAPKPKIAEDFKKSMREVGTQTEATEQAAKKLKKKAK